MFYIRLDKSPTPIIDVDEDTLVTLESIEETPIGAPISYTLKVRFRVDSFEARNQSIQTVKVSLYSKIIQQNPLLARQNGSINNQKTIDNIPRQSQSMYSLSSEQLKCLIAQKKVDLTAYIDNSSTSSTIGDVPSRRGGLAPRITKRKIDPTNLRKRKTLILKKIGELRDEGEAKPVYNQTIKEITTFDSPDTPGFGSTLAIKSLMHDMIVYSGLDPSVVTKMNHVSLTPKIATQGLLLKQRTESTSNPTKEQNKLFDAIIGSSNSNNLTSSDELNGAQTTVVFESVPQRYVFIEQVIKFDAAKLGDKNSFVIRFEAIQATSNVTKDYVDVPSNLTRHIINHRTPLKPPRMKVSKGGSETTLELIQEDKRATAIKLFRKTLFRTAPRPGDYEFFGEFPLSYKQRLTVPTPTPINSYYIYRAISVSRDIMGHDYTNAIVRPKKIYPNRSITLVSLLDPTGILLQIKNIPDDVVAIQMLYKNLESKEGWRNLSTPIFISDDVRTNDVITYLHKQLKNNWTYEYTLKLIYYTGSEEKACYSAIKFVQAEEGKVDTRITDLVVDSSSLNVSFNITTSINDSTLDQTKTLLESQGASSYYDDAIKAARSQLKQVISHKVDRINLTTGVRETFASITDGVFDDIKLSAKNAVKPLEYGNEYRYEVYTLLRDPETLITTLSVVKIDETTLKPYKFYPSRFKHPLTLSRGTLVTNSSVKLNHPEEEMVHGLVGSVVTTSANFSEYSIDINNVVVTKIDLNTNWVSWRVTGNAKNIDSLLVLKDANGVRNFIGKAHLENEQNSVKFIHKLTDNDRGEFRYYIVPVFNDYNLSDGVYSTPVVVN